MIRVLALDLSLTRSGYALADGTHGVLAPPFGAEAPMARLRWIRGSVDRLVTMQRPNVVVIEGYSFNSEISRAHAAGELGGVIRLLLFESTIPFAEVPPASLKMFATGNGGVKKDAVLVAAVQQLGYTGHDNNESDALWLRQMALAKYEPSKPPTFQLEPERRKGSKSLATQRARALEGVQWPALELAVR